MSNLSITNNNRARFEVFIGEGVNIQVEVFCILLLCSEYDISLRFLDSTTTNC